MKKIGWRKFPEKNPVDLWSDPPHFDSSIDQDEPTITPYLLKGKSNGCIIVLPGGNFIRKSLHEAEPVAQWLNGLGIASFVLDYRVSPYHAPVPFLDVARAIRTVRARADEWGIDPCKIGVLGFSAGGHLAACAATMHDNGDPTSDDPIERVSSRPDAAVLCYALTDLISHESDSGTLKNLFGEDHGDTALQAAWSPAHNVDSNISPIFLWHTAKDTSVPIENSFKMATAAKNAGGQVELHIYPDGRHGLGLADNMDAGRWKSACASFFSNLDFI